MLGNNVSVVLLLCLSLTRSDQSLRQALSHTNDIIPAVNK